MHKMEDTVPPSQGECTFRFFRYRLDVPNPRVCRAQFLVNRVCALGQQPTQCSLSTPGPEAVSAMITANE